MLTPEQILSYKQELSSISIELSEDPTTEGLGLVNGKIAEINAQKERVGSILMDTLSNVQERKRHFEEAKLAYDLKYERILSTDESVRNLKSEALRSAATNAQISDDFLIMRKAEMDLGDAEAFQKIVQHKYNLLESANSNVSRQITVVQLQLEIGEVQRRGSYTPPGSGRIIRVSPSEE
jgi:hypothetical protein